MKTTHGIFARASSASTQPNADLATTNARRQLAQNQTSDLNLSLRLVAGKFACEKPQKSIPITTGNGRMGSVYLTRREHLLMMLLLFEITRPLIVI